MRSGLQPWEMRVDSLKTISHWLFILSVTLPIMGGVCALVQYFVSSKISDLEATERAGTIATISSKVQPRHITNRQALREALAPMSSAPIHLLADTYDSEVSEFGGTLKQVLTEAGVPLLGAYGPFPWIPPGVTLVFRDRTLAAAHQVRISEALKSSGVPTLRVYGPDDPLPSAWAEKISQPVTILVGRR